MAGVTLPGGAGAGADPVVQVRRREALGWGLAAPLLVPGADLGRDVLLASGPNGRDLGVVEGIDNLIQGLQVALTTGLGTDPFNTEFGFDGIRVLAEEADPVLARERVRIAVVNVLRRDSRVAQIVDLQLIDGRPPADGGPGTVDAWRTATVRCVVQAASTDTVSLTVDGGSARG
jgi:phage baseplate assembly protein W